MSLINFYAIFLTCIATAEDVIVVCDVRELGLGVLQGEEQFIANWQLIGDPLDRNFAGIK